MIKTRRDNENKHNSNKHCYWIFKCKCGKEVSKRGDNNTEYCNKPGCKYSKRINHGCSYTSLYSAWEGIIQRTTNPKSKSSKTYFHKGITLHEDWKKFYSFKEWAENNGYKKGLTIDRINIDGNYEPSNCEWVTRSENTLRQNVDGHGSKNMIKISINEIEYISAAEAARHLSKKIGKNVYKSILYYASKPNGGIMHKKYNIKAI